MGMNDTAHDAGRPPAPAPESSPPLYVVGFSGSVSEGAAAIKPPVFELGGRYFSGDPESPPAVTHGREEIEEYRERGLLSLVSEPQLRKPDHVFLYAHPTFLLPSVGACNLHPELGTLRLDDALGAYYEYMSRKHAIARLRRWAEVLLEDAKESLNASRFRQAKESAMRARFGATRELPELRTEAHCYVAAARLGLGEDIEGVLWNVAFDFSEDVAERVGQRARGLVSRVRRWEELRGGRGRQRSEGRYTYQFAAAA